ncbi:zinc-binding alcohol dehydrogenase family protein [Rhizobium puerariae]|uniref:Zinc-binding alcohol dehydrogenase family protein n=1 Tax=Rhizobium puerariae TaxID=1585791 RepID=A0ABV6AQG7_9HYPH
MKAIVVKKFGNPPEMVVEDRHQPVPKDGFSLVRLHAATVNQLSNTLRKGEMASAPAPLVLGNEGSGVVEAGARFQPGTRVAIYGGSVLGITRDGLFQQWALVEDRRLLALPDNLNWDEGAALTVNYLTAYLALTRIAKVQPGQVVLISGASGSVGHALVQVAKALGGRPIGIASSAVKAERVRAAGAFEAIDLSTQDVGEAVHALTDGQGADVALDPVGGSLFGQLLQALRPRGTLVSIGFTGGKQAEVDVVDVIVNEKSLIGYSLHAEPDETAAQALVDIGKLAAQGLLKPVIDGTYLIEDFEQAYSRLTSREAVGSVILHL